jgi:hypothetical protein
MVSANDRPLDDDVMNVHPAIRMHRETGRKALFVDPLWTEQIVELEANESAGSFSSM